MQSLISDIRMVGTLVRAAVCRLGLRALARVEPLALGGPQAARSYSTESPDPALALFPGARAAYTEKLDFLHPDDISSIPIYRY